MLTVDDLVPTFGTLDKQHVGANNAKLCAVVIFSSYFNPLSAN